MTAKFPICLPTFKLYIYYTVEPVDTQPNDTYVVSNVPGLLMMRLFRNSLKRISSCYLAPLERQTIFYTGSVSLQMG